MQEINLKILLESFKGENMIKNKKNKYGYFDEKNREYVLTNPKTPVKWINYVGNISFGGFVDTTGGSLICKGDPALNRITKYIPQLPDSDFKGETAYIRIKNGKNKYKIFSPYFVPTIDRYKKYEAHIGLLYTKIISEFYGIRTEVVIFVPMGSNHLIRDYRITNISKKSIEIDFIPVVEYTHPDALKQLTNADWVPQTMQSEVRHKENELIVLAQFAFMNKGLEENYFTSNYPVSSFETDRRIFLGDNGYGSWREPLGLLNEELSNYEARRGDNIAALMHHLGSLKPGETKRIITQLSNYPNIKKALKNIQKYRIEKNIDDEFNKIKEFWDNTLSVTSVNTPDKEMNVLLNVFNPYQSYITLNWSRYLSLYQLGFGARGIGFRDSSQDVMGAISLVPEQAKSLIEKLLHIQKYNGSAMHQFNPITMIANEGDSREKEDAPKYYGDDHLWIILAVATYLKETGDIKFLNKEIPFYDKDKTGKSIYKATVLEHLKKGIEFTYKNRGKHGLPLLGFADWNDTVNLASGAESLFIANLFGVALKEMIGLTEFLKENNLSRKYKRYYNEMREIVNQYGWDGNWYIRYLDKDGNPIGSKINKEGKIYTNAQTWTVLSGFATTERAKKALDSVYKYLNTKNGIKLSTPGYKKFDPEKGGVTTYPPGAKENGGIFLHANTWAVIAEAIFGNGNRAFEYYSQINPIKKNDNIDNFESEPYVYPQNILGDEHPQFGLARNSWLSGTSSWMYQAGIKYILGVNPDFSGLKIDPSIPDTWSGFTVKRKFRNSVYDIIVKNPDRVSKGIKKIVVDGTEIEGNILPLFNDKKVHKVEVLMGKE